MGQTLEVQVRSAATKARDLLGQLGPLAWALHVIRQPAGAFAVCVDREPEKYVEIRTDEDETEREERKRHVVETLQQLRDHRSGGESSLFESVGCRAAINRSIVVYAVAALEEFFDQAGKPVWKQRRSEQAQNWPPDTLGKIALLDALDSNAPKLCRSDHYVETGWLVLVRNAIIHADGKAGRKTRKDASQHGLGPRWRCRPESLVWDSSATQQLAGDEWNGMPFSMAIDHFIMPRLRDAQSFVAEAEEVLRQAAHNYTSASETSE